MSFFTSLTGLNAATTQLSVTSNNIANAGTTGFKRSRSDFGDIFATSPLQKASTVVGQGTALKQVTQEFSQGNIELSGNSLDLAVTGEGFFPLRSADGQNLFTRNGSFLLDEQNTVVNSAGQFLRVASVDSLGKADFQADLVPLTIAPTTVGQAIATSEIGLAINFPAESLPQTTVNEANIETIKPFDQNDPTTYAKSAAVTIFDENGNDFLLTFFYRRVGVATADDPFNKWQTHIVLDGQEITPGLGQATATDETPLYVDKYGNILPEDELPTAVRNNAVFRKYVLDDLADPTVSAPAKASGALVELPYLAEEAGVNFAPTVASTSISVVEDQLANIGDTSHTILTTAIAGNVITVDDHGLMTGDRVVYDAQSGTTATGLIDQAEYYVVKLSDSTFQLAQTRANALADTPVPIAFSGGNDSQQINYRETVSLTMKDSDNATLATLSTVNAASASIDLIKNGDIESNDRVSLKLTVGSGSEATSVNITTAALAADASVTDVVDALNRASAAKALNIKSIATDAVTNESTITATGHGYQTGDRVTFNQHGGAAITGLIDGTEYFIVRLTDDTFQVAATYADATSSPAVTVQSIAATADDTNTTATFDSAEGTGQYVFATDSDSDGDIIVPSRIVISRADGNNFSIASDITRHSLSGDAAIHENISAESPEISSTSTSRTQNGSRLDSTTTIDELVTALHRSASEFDFEIELSTTANNTIDISKADGTNFSVTANRLPNGTDGLFAALQNEALTALAQGGVSDATSNGVIAPDFSAAFDLTIDEDPLDPNATDSLTIDLSVLNAPENASLSGDEVAELMTKEINRQFGDQRYFNLSSNANRQFRMTFDANPNDTTAAQIVDIYIPASAVYTEKSLAQEIQAQLRAATGTKVSVNYSGSSKGFVFSPESDISQLTISNVPASASLTGAAAPNTLFGLNTLSSNFTLDSRGRYAAEVIPNGNQIVADEDQQRYGIKVEFVPDDESGGKFTIASGKTGDGSAIRIENMSAAASAYFGFDADSVNANELEVVAVDQTTALRGVESTAAKVFGKPVSIDPDEAFFVDDLTNEFTVTVDNVTETFRLPVGNYNLNSFKTALENRINSMEDSLGNSISGVRVNFDQINEIFQFTSGTTGDSSFLQISGSSRYGLEDIESSVGQTSTFRKPVADLTESGQDIYVAKDENGVFREYSADFTSGLSPLPGNRTFTEDPEYRPLFLDKGELTFDTAGNLVSPLNGISLDNVVIGGSGNTLNIDIGYAGSTQFSGAFSVNSQSQNGQPNGSLVAVDIADDGLVTASYSNGTQDLKGKIVLSTFSTPNGLRQLGDSTFLESNESGAPTLGEPGGAGFGTIRAGARERANVDLTSELVDLITAQRNFQANAKAIETSSTLTSTIINIRS